MHWFVEPGLSSQRADPHEERGDQHPCSEDKEALLSPLGLVETIRSPDQHQWRHPSAAQEEGDSCKAYDIHSLPWTF